MRIIAWRAVMDTAWQPSRAAHITSQAITRRAGYAIPTPRESNVELATGVHLPVEGWADVRIGQSLKINISLTIAKS